MNLLKPLMKRLHERKEWNVSKAPRFLVVQIAGIGDLVLATPVLDALKERYPECRMIVLTSPRAGTLLASHPSVDELFEFDISRFRNPLVLRSKGARKKLLAQLEPLKERNFDAILSLNNVSTVRGGFTIGGLFRLVAPSAFWAGRNTDGRAPYFDGSVDERSRDPRPEALTKLAVAKHVGVDAIPRALSLPLGKAELAKARELLGEKKWIAMMPGANVAAKQWPVDRFANVAEYFAAKGYSFALLGGPDERYTGELIEKVVGARALNLMGDLDLRETAAVLHHCTLAITNDTGPMHMAAAVGCPIVALFCSLNIKRYRPWMAENAYRALTTEPEANPASETGMRQSVRGVTSEMVIEAAEDLLKELS